MEYRARLHFLIAFFSSFCFIFAGGIPSALANDPVTHTVRPGESLYLISLRYGVTVDEIASANNIIDTWTIFAGQELVIPGLSTPDQDDEVVNPLVAAPPQTHVAQFGETVETIALNYGTTVEAILRVNELTSASLIFPGDELKIWMASPMRGEDTNLANAPANTPPSETAVNATAITLTGENPESSPELAEDTIIHVMQWGETLSQIAGRYNADWREIAEVNGITAVTRVFAGTELIIPGNNETPQAAGVAADVSEAYNSSVSVFVESDTAATGEEPVEHVIAPGETLSQIAQRHGVPVNEIMEANGIANPNTVAAGTKLTIPSIESVLEKYGITPVLAPPEVDPGAHVGVGREIVVDLSDSTIYAYEDGVLVRKTLVSTGLPATPTVQGDFKIYKKYPTQTMSGPGYHLPNVESVMYFFQGYAIHGTYWHNNFGRPMSHGCVNLTEEEATWFFEFAQVGTPVHVRA